MLEPLSETTPYEPEPELRAPAPRAIRLRVPFRAGPSEAGKIALLFAFLAVAFVLCGPGLTWLQGRFGQVVPARVTYTADFFLRLKATRMPPEEDVLMAHFVYDLRGARHQATRPVRAALLNAFPNHGTVPIRVLAFAPWTGLLVWTPRDGVARWQARLRREGWEALLMTFFCGAASLFFLVLERGTERARRQAVSEGSPFGGRLIGCRDRRNRLLSPGVDFPTRGNVSVHYEAPAPPRRWHRTGGIVRFRTPAPAALAARLPPPGSQVTVLRSAEGLFTTQVLYAVGRYEARSPG